MKLRRFLSDGDAAAFCRKVTEALNKCLELHVGPTHAHDPAKAIMHRGQAVVKVVPGLYTYETVLSEQ